LLITWRQLVSGSGDSDEADVLVPTDHRVAQGPKRLIRVYYGSQTGTAKGFAEQLFKDLEKLKEDVNCEELSLHNLSSVDADSLSDFNKLATPEKIPVAIFSWRHMRMERHQIKCSGLRNQLKTTLVTSVFLKPSLKMFTMSFSVLEIHCMKAAAELNDSLNQLGALPILALTKGDENPLTSEFGSLVADFNMWKRRLLRAMLSANELPSSTESNSETQELIESSSDDEQDDDDDDIPGKDKKEPKNNDSQSQVRQRKPLKPGSNGTFEKKSLAQNGSNGGVLDLEDIGTVVKAARKKVAQEKEERYNGILKEMVTPDLRKALTKQGYKIVGTHSGVKLCRWTKSMLRGRADATSTHFTELRAIVVWKRLQVWHVPTSVHHSNPVGTEWKWQMEDPNTILDGMLQNHYKMINEFKGVPGVMQHRLDEGMQARHCALSLVGEPIMYPEINRFVRLLHEKAISTFLVTNAQFPDAILNLDPVTQLYVSVDAATKESLKKIDRPLFRDFWERFIDSLKALRDKKQRTVYRLTLVKDFNVTELDNYAKLVELGNPDFIEIKGVTYCGTSKASTLTMENVPWHEENLCNTYLPDYQLACEHEHSNCVLVAHKRFLIDNEWHTWIDYDKFHELFKEYKSSGTSFSAMDYAARTPDWACYGATERGFDPVETRWQRKNTKKEIGVAKHDSIGTFQNG
ncbi:S-adenosyl-L-methionine-dependent tRNA 4-demethylwyosine synthase, partial [Orchesella cincta]